MRRSTSFGSPAKTIDSLIFSRRLLCRQYVRIAQKRIDYAVYDAAMTLRAVIELDDRTHNAKQDALRDSYLASAGIVTLRFQSKRKPSPAEIQAALQQVQAA